VLNLGRYERQAYLNVGGRLTGKQKEAALAQKERDFRDLILRAYKAQPLEGEGFFHGKNAGRLVVVGPINLPVGRLFVEEVITECRKRGASRVDVLAFEFEMGLFPASLDEARGKGIDLAPKYIPAEVFDKRAVDFDYMSREEIIKVAKDMGEPEFEERWTGNYIFENEWQSFRTRKNRELELISAPHTYTAKGRYTMAVKVIDIFGNDTMVLVPVNVG
jgi:hypothetical protein